MAIEALVYDPQHDVLAASADAHRPPPLRLLLPSGCDVGHQLVHLERAALLRLAARPELPLILLTVGRKLTASLLLFHFSDHLRRGDRSQLHAGHRN